MTGFLQPGQPLPWFRLPQLGTGQSVPIDTQAGRPLLLLVAGRAGWPDTAAALALLRDGAPCLFDGRARAIGLTIDPQDAADPRIATAALPWLLDTDAAVCRSLGAIDAAERFRPHWLLLDAQLRVAGTAPIAAGARLFAMLPALCDEAEEDRPAPVLTVPRLLEPELCRALIAAYEAAGGTESGFMRDVDGRTQLIVDPQHKRRRDHVIDDPRLLAALRTRMTDRLRPMIARAFQFEATRIERWLVACYDAADGGHFGAHRDNTTLGTAHRRFACTINLNAEDHEGGALSFPEHGPRRYRAPTGGAVIFSCSMLHQVDPVTAGRRYAFLPFFYGEEDARLRERNAPALAPEHGGYRSGLAA